MFGNILSIYDRDECFYVAPNQLNLRWICLESKESTLAAVDIIGIETSTGERPSFNLENYSDIGRFGIGKYANEDDSAPSIWKFRTKFPKLNENENISKEDSVRGFQKMYENELSKSKDRQFKTVSTEKRGRHLLLVRVDNLT